jgi:hypothetical protein
MHRSALVLTAFLLSAAAALGSGCANGASSIIPGSSANQTVAPSSGAASREVSARTVRVASTAARAQVCGLTFDAAKLRASYLDYAAKQGLDGAQLSSVGKNYDAALRTTSAQGAVIAGRCSAQQVAWTRDRSAEFSQGYKEEIEAELRRYLAGSFTFGEKTPNADEPFNARSFWKEQDDG